MALNTNSTIAVNNTPEEIITKKFLQNALQKEAYGSPVPNILSYSATSGTKPGDNFMSVIYSIDVKLDNGTTRHLLIKCYSNHPSRQEFTNNSNMFFKECQVYSKWMPELRRFQTEVLGLTSDQVIKLPYAGFVHGECIDFESSEGAARKSGRIHSMDNFILMEDVRKTSGFRMTNRREPLDIDHMRLAVEALAKVQSLSWAYRHHVEPKITEKFPCLVTAVSEKDIELWTNVILLNLDNAKGIYDKEFGPGNEYSAAAESFRQHVPTVERFLLGKFPAEGLEKLFRISNFDPKKFGKDSENPEPWSIICHGDCWSNNMLFRYDQETGKPCEVILVDLQMPQETCVINDLEYVMHASTDLDLRRGHTDELLQLYHDTFNRVCELTKTPTLPGFNMDSLRFRFHRGKFLGYYMAMLGLPIMLKEEDKGVDFEGLEADKDISEAFAELASGCESNPILKQRLIDITKGMIEDGVL